MKRLFPLFVSNRFWQHVQRARASLTPSLLLAVLVVGCTTYYDPIDPYVKGLRSFDRGSCEQTLAYWKPLAEQGDCDAQFRYGALFNLGACVDKNDTEFIKWIEKAANQGQGFAQFSLMGAYLHEPVGIGTPKRPNLSLNCRRGCGVDRDRVKAYKWARLALKHHVYESAREHSQLYVYLLEGDFNAALKMRTDKEHSDEVISFLKQFVEENELTPKQKAEAEEMINAWKPNPSLCKQRKML